MKLKTAKNAAIMTAAAVLLGTALTSCGSSNSLTLNVYNWGEYISDGSEGSLPFANLKSGMRKTTVKRSL